jgi:hypothetical protein
MQLPASPPDIRPILDRVAGAPVNTGPMIRIYGGTAGPTPQGKYAHWDILRNTYPPRQGSPLSKRGPP